MGCKLPKDKIAGRDPVTGDVLTALRVLMVRFSPWF